MRNRFFLSVALLVVVGSVGFAEPPTTQPVAGERIRYTSEKLGFSVEAPSSWDFDESIPGKAFLYSPDDGPDDTVSENLAFGRIDVSQYAVEVSPAFVKSVAQRAQKVLAKQFKNFEGGDIVEQEVAGMAAVVSTFQMVDGEGNKLKCRKWHLMVDKKTICVVVFQSAAEKFDGMVPLATTIVDSIQLAE